MRDWLSRLNSLELTKALWNCRSSSGAILVVVATEIVAGLGNTDIAKVMAAA